MHCHYISSTRLEYTVTAHPGHSSNTWSLLYLHHTAVRYSHYNSSTQIEYTVTARIHDQCTLSTHLEYIVSKLLRTTFHLFPVIARAPAPPGDCTITLWWGGEVWEPEDNGYTRLTTTLWSLSICRWVSLARIQHQACVGWSDGYTPLITLWWCGEVW